MVLRIDEPLPPDVQLVDPETGLPTKDFLGYMEQLTFRINDRASLPNLPTVDNFVSFDSNGDLQDSGLDVTSSPVVGEDDAQTLTNKILTTPTIGDFSNAGHDHSNATNGDIISLNRDFQAGSHGIGDITNGHYTDIDYTGLLTFLGTAGLPFGELYIHDADIDLVIAGADAYTQITNLTQGLLKNLTMESNGLKIAKEGLYLVIWNLSGCAQAGINQNYHFALFKEAAEQNNGSGQFQSNEDINEDDADIKSTSGVAVLDCAVDDNIDLRVKNVGDSENLNVKDVSLIAIMIGGT